MGLHIAMDLDVVINMVTNTPVSVNKIYKSDVNNICVILRNGESGTYGYFYSGANNGTTPSNMTDSNAQL